MSTLLRLSQYSAVCAIGCGIEPIAESLRHERSGLAPCQYANADLPTFIGRVPGVESVKIPDGLRRFDCRNNRLAELALAQDGFADAVGRLSRHHGSQRIGVFLGTSSSGVTAAEEAYRERNGGHAPLPEQFDYAATLNFYSVAAYVRERLGIEGPSAVIGCACASSAKAFASARRMILSGGIDAAIVGGVESLCLTSLYGFNSLQLCSAAPCRPFDRGRDGLSLGESAAFVILERATSPSEGDVMLLGVGESSDGYHLSSPHPQGLGAEKAMRAALSCAGLSPSSIDYINLHGTGTRANDLAEGMAVAKVFGPDIPCSSTKGLTGHTLGACGALECVLSAIALRSSLMPAGRPTTEVDPACGVNYLTAARSGSINFVMSNSFGFGGANCSLLLGASAPLLH